MDGMFLEIGPFRVSEDKTLKMIEHHWAKHSTILFGNYPFCTCLLYASGSTCWNWI